MRVQVQQCVGGGGGGGEEGGGGGGRQVCAPCSEEKRVRQCAKRKAGKSEMLRQEQRRSLGRAQCGSQHAKMS